MFAENDSRGSSPATNPVRQESVQAKDLIGWIRHLRWEGFERSFKMSEGSVLWNRFLVGVRTIDIRPEPLLEICDRMRMPADHREKLLQRLHEANQVLFGIEESESGCVYKVYLEFWDKVTAEIRSQPNRTDPRIIHIGFKWDPATPSKSAIARYTCYPLLAVPAILSRLDQLYATHRNTASLDVTKRIIQTAVEHVGDKGFIYIEVQEDGNPRRSFDINLYKAQLTLADIQAWLMRTASQLRIPQTQFDQEFGRVRAKLLGHLAGGMDRRGNDFLTTYYEDEPGSTLTDGSQNSPQDTSTRERVGRNDPCPCGSGKKFKKCCGG